MKQYVVTCFNKDPKVDKTHKIIVEAENEEDALFKLQGRGELAYDAKEIRRITFQWSWLKHLLTGA